MVNHDGWQTTVVDCGVVVDVEAKLLLLAFDEDEDPGDFVELPLALCFDVDERLLVCSLES